MKETIKDAGYEYIKMLRPGQHILREGGHYDVFYTCKGHASWGLKYKNTHLEFGYTIKQAELSKHGI